MHDSASFQFISADPAMIETVCRAGGRWIQFREKNLQGEALLERARTVREICAQYEATCIINDYPEIAGEVQADGVHLGKEDKSPAGVRQILGDAAIIGGTANTLEDVQRLVAQGVDYIGLGPFRFTTTKQNLSPVLGLEGYKKIMRACPEAGIAVPVVAIGGIVPADVPALLQAGVHGVAVSSVVGNAKEPEQVVRDFSAAVSQGLLQPMNVERE